MIVGIDLGTTNSLIGVYGPDGPQLIPNALGNLLTPSAVSVDATGTIIVGQAARDRLVSHPHDSVATFKRWMGTPRETRIGTQSFRPEELSALVLRALLQDAENFLGARPTEAVISVPAYFGDAQRKATRAAGELAGLRVDRLINEPTAAALAYGLDARMDGSTFMVLDLGGGTFDVSILEIFDGVMKVHASAGDNAWAARTSSTRCARPAARTSGSTAASSRCPSARCCSRAWRCSRTASARPTPPRSSSTPAARRTAGRSTSRASPRSSTRWCSASARRSSARCATPGCSRPTCRKWCWWAAPRAWR
jgi:hypothetical protein